MNRKFSEQCSYKRPHPFPPLLIFIQYWSLAIHVALQTHLIITLLSTALTLANRWWKKIQTFIFRKIIKMGHEVRHKNVLKYISRCSEILELFLTLCWRKRFTRSVLGNWNIILCNYAFKTFSPLNKAEFDLPHYPFFLLRLPSLHPKLQNDEVITRHI